MKPKITKTPSTPARTVECWLSSWGIDAEDIACRLPPPSEFVSADGLTVRRSEVIAVRAEVDCELWAVMLRNDVDIPVTKDTALALIAALTGKTPS